MRRALLGLLLLAAACDQSGLKKKELDELCKKNLDCAYGLERVDGARGKTCQWHSFGDCEGDGTQPGSDNEPQCLNTYKCREGHCTVQCASHKDCKEGEVCKVGICQAGANARGSCYDNRDCPYPETCYYGQCVTRTPSTRCVSDLDCDKGFRCINGVCQ